MVETILAVIFILVGIIAHIVYKKKWKMVDYF
jgi:uncharacterized membrane protein